MQDKVFEFISYIITALSNCSLYSDSHPAVIYHAEKAVKVMDDLFVEDTISLAIIGSNMIFNDVPFAAKNILVSNLIKRLRRKGIEKIIFTKGVTAEELKGFIAEIAFSKRISGIYPHITSGSHRSQRKTDDGGQSVQSNGKSISPRSRRHTRDFRVIKRLTCSVSRMW